MKFERSHRKDDFEPDFSRRRGRARMMIDNCIEG